MPLLIPPQDYPSLSKLLHLSEATAKSLIKALQEEPPALYLSKLSSRVSQKTGLSRPETYELLHVGAILFSSYKKLGRGLDEFLGILRETLAEANVPGLTFTADEWKTRKSFIGKFLECEDSVGVTAKALNVMVDHGRIFRDVRILTDFRPVFRSNPSQPPAAAVIIHTLKIEYKADRLDKEFFVALDSRDIDRLEKLIKRAKLKEKALKLSVRPSKILILEP